MQKQVGFLVNKKPSASKKLLVSGAPKNEWPSPSTLQEWTHQSSCCYARLELPEDLASNLAKEVGEVFQPAIFETLEEVLDDGILEMHGNAWFGCKHRNNTEQKLKFHAYCMSFRTYFIDFLRRS